MSRHEKDPQIRRLPRFIRGRQFDRDPPRRASDRVESVVLIVLLTAFSIGRPWLRLSVAAWCTGIGRRNMTAQQASRYQVTAAATQSQHKGTCRSRPRAGRLRTGGW